MPHRPAAGFGALFSAVMLPMFLGAVDQTLLAAAMPRIAHDLGALSDVSWVAVGYLLALTVTAPLYGRLGDRFGRARMLCAALGVFMLGSLACALAGSLWGLVLARVLQGMGGGGLMVLSHALIGELVPPQDRPLYQGWFAGVFSVSSVTGPVLGGFVAEHGDWRWLFWANLPLGAFALWRILRLPRSTYVPRRNQPYDPVGVVLFAVCAASGLLWLSLVGHRFPLASPPSAGLAGLAVAAGCVLAWQQRRHPAPFLPVDVLRVPGVRWICLSVLGFGGTMFALVFLLPIYLQVARQSGAAGAGLQLLPLSLGVVVGSALNGRVALRMRRSGVLAPWGLSAASVALFALALLPPSPALITAVAAVCGLGLGTVMPNAQISTQMLAGRERLGAAAGLLALTRSTGASFGTAAFGGLAFALLDVGGRGAEQVAALPPEVVTRAFHVVFGVVAVYAAAGAWAASRAPRMDLDARAQPAASAA